MVASQGLPVYPTKGVKETLSLFYFLRMVMALLQAQGNKNNLNAGQIFKDPHIP